MKWDVLVIGSGLAGSTAARLLAEKGKKVIVVEKRCHIGGNCYDLKDITGIKVHKYGPHIFHTNNKHIWDFVNSFSKFNNFQHRVLSYAEGRMIPFPINRDTICDVFGINIPVNEVLNHLKSEVEKSTFNAPPQNFRDAVVSQVGERLYDLFFKNYTLKQWEKDPEELSPEIAARIPVRENRDPRYFSDKYQGIPVLGYTGMIENMLDHENISLMLNTDYFNIKDEITAELTVYTGKLDEYFNYCYGELEYRSVIFDFTTEDVEFFQSAPVVNYPNDYDFTRITEFKYFTGEKSNMTSLCYEYPSSSGIPCYVVLSKENIEKKEKYQILSSQLEKKGTHIFAGRLAEYKYYNMDQVIEKTINLINSR
jgi:UDP-galactopyranose mutase